MKNKYLTFIIAGLIFIGLIISLILFKFNDFVTSVIVSCSAGILVALLIILIQAFAIPSKWAFNNRFGFGGMLFITLGAFSASILDEKAFSSGALIISLLIGVIVGFLGLGFLPKRNLKIISEKMASEYHIPASELIIGGAVFNENNQSIHGKLILIKRKLLFIPVDSDNPLHEIDFDPSHPITIKRTFLPNGIIINDHLQFMVSFPRFWIKTIKAA